jgi:hypothetical protein
MFNKSRRAAVALLVATGALGASVLATGAAEARPPATGAAFYQKGLDEFPIYQLNDDQQFAVCGEFQGTIVYSDGYSVDCRSGNVYYEEPQSNAS